jgi:hypothetical protein
MRKEQDKSLWLGNSGMLVSMKLIRLVPALVLAVIWQKTVEGFLGE